VDGKISFNKVTTLSNKIRYIKIFNNLFNLLSDMSTRGYEYDQIRVCIHIIMGSQIPIYYTRGYPFATRPVPVTDFVHGYPWA